jgi:uncharacterized protein
MAHVDFLGRGWAFPVAPDQTGEVRLVEDAEDIREAIRIIVETEPGERVMRPDFGAGLRSIVFEPMNTGTIALVQHRVLLALTTWEPRIDGVTVAVTADAAATGRLDVRIDYRIRATNTFDNLVYPFYLQEGRA